MDKKFGDGLLFVNAYCEDGGIPTPATTAHIQSQTKHMCARLQMVEVKLFNIRPLITKLIFIITIFKGPTQPCLQSLVPKPLI